MSSYTGLSPKGPSHYVGPNVYLPTLVTRKRSPTGADFRQPETGKLYPTGSYWLTGSSPTTGTEGDLWYLSKIVANVAYWLMLSSGGSGPILNFDVQASTAPGVDPVTPTGSGTVIINGAVVPNHSVVLETHTRALNTYNLEVQYATTSASSDGTKSGVSHYNSAHFSVGPEGFVSLLGGGGAIDSVQVDAISGTGTNPVVPTVAGLITVTGALVAAGTNPIRTVSTLPNSYQIQMQTSQALAAADATKVGASNYNNTQFTVSPEGFVSLLPDGIVQGVENLGIKYASSTFSVTSADGTALSATNVAYVTIQSSANPGRLIRVPVTADQTFIDSTGASTIDNNLFGTTTAVAFAEDLPFFVYAVLNTAETAISFMISRYPNTSISPVAGKIGKTGSAVASTSGSFFALNNPTVSDYASQPALSIGGFRMQKTAGDDWTVQTLSFTDGIGKFHLSRRFIMVTGQFGAASGKYFANNGGTAPAFTTNSYVYAVNMSNSLAMNASFGSASTAGVGSVDLTLNVPYTIESLSVPIGFSFITPTYSSITFVQANGAGSNSGTFVLVNDLGSKVFQNSDVALGSILGFTASFPIAFT